MDHHSLFSNSEFEKLFESGKFPVALFNHEAHLRLAWIHIHQYGLQNAIENVSRQLKHYVLIQGAKDKYNHTLTIAAVKAVNHFYNRTPEPSFSKMISRFPRLVKNFKSLMETHYSIDVFNDKKARILYVEPDIPF